MRLISVLLFFTFCFFSTSPVVQSCTFCDGSLRARLTLRLQYANARAVLVGQLQNPRFDPNTDGGTTELRITSVIKDDPARRNRDQLTLGRYLPVAMGMPSEQLIFCGLQGGNLDPTFVVPATPGLIDYLKGVLALNANDPASRLGFYFAHLDSRNPTIAADAFAEFALATDGDILKASKLFSPAKIRILLTDPATPAERLGVYAFLLGVSGNADDAAFLGRMLKMMPLPERIANAFGGLLAGYILLDGNAGWALTASVLADEKRGYSERLAAIGTVRFFQKTRPEQSRNAILNCYAALIPQGDLADQAIEDLRRWGYWELTPAVLGQYNKPTHAAPIVRRSIIRYALTCPTDEAKKFAASLRQADPKLVGDIEEKLAGRP